MSAASQNYDGTLNPIFNKNEAKTKFWVRTCETGLRYAHLFKKKYFVTQAVLDPKSQKKEIGNKLVCVIMEYNKEEHLIAVLKHDNIYQVNLNLLFDQEEVTFFLRGTGVVTLLGYEVIEPHFESSFTSTPFRGIKPSKIISNCSPMAESLSDSKISESEKRSKSPMKDIGPSKIISNALPKAESLLNSKISKTGKKSKSPEKDIEPSNIISNGLPKAESLSNSKISKSGKKSKSPVKGIEPSKIISNGSPMPESLSNSEISKIGTRSKSPMKGDKSSKIISNGSPMAESLSNSKINRSGRRAKSPMKGDKPSKIISNGLPMAESLSNSKISNSGKKSKSPKKVDAEEDVTTGNNKSKPFEDDDKDIGDVECEDAISDKEENDDDVEDNVEDDVEDDVEEEKSDIENSEMEINALKTEEEESEESSPPEPATQKRKKKFDGKNLKRSKMETPLSIASLEQKYADAATFEESFSDSSDVSVPIEKKDKKEKKKLKTFFKLDKTQQMMSTHKSLERGAVVTLEGGVEVTDLKIGHGPTATKGNELRMFYIGKLSNRDIFHSVLPGRKPIKFKLGANKVMKGWEIGVEGMKVGGQRKLKIPPSMGYGKEKMKGVPPNSTLHFSVELVAVK